MVTVGSGHLPIAARRKQLWGEDVLLDELPFRQNIKLLCYQFYRNYSGEC